MLSGVFAIRYGQIPAMGDWAGPASARLRVIQRTVDINVILIVREGSLCPILYRYNSWYFAMTACSIGSNSSKLFVIGCSIVQSFQIATCFLYSTSS